MDKGKQGGGPKNQHCLQKSILVYIWDWFCFITVIGDTDGTLVFDGKSPAWASFNIK